MIARLKIACLAGFALASVGAGSASAMPAAELQSALSTSADHVTLESVRLICRPFRGCYRVPGYYGYARPYGYYRPYYGYRPAYRQRFFY